MDFSTGQRNRLDTVFKRCYNWKIADRKDQNIETNALPFGSEEVYTHLPTPHLRRNPHKNRSVIYMNYNCHEIVTATEAQLKYFHDTTLQGATPQELHDALGKAVMIAM